MKSVTIQLDRPRRLRFDYNALSDVEEKAGMGIGAILSEQRIGFAMTRVLLWGGLKWEDRKLTLEKVGELLQAYFQGGGSWDDIIATIFQAVNASGLFSPVTVEADEKNGETEAATN